MVSKVNTFFGFDKGCIPGGEFMVIGQSGQDGSFLLHHVVNGALKEDRGVVLGSLVQKFNHYNTISQKIGNSLQLAKDAGQLSFVDGLQIVSEALFPTEQKSTISADNKWGDENSNAVKNLLENFREKLVMSITEISSKGRCPSVLLIDDLLVLVSVGVPVEDVCLMMQDLLQSVFMIGSTDSKPPEYEGLSVVVLCTYEESDRDSKVLWSYLSHMSSVWVNIKGLDTGYCKDVHGQACVTWQDGMDKPRQRWTRTQQFKVLENGADFFAAGTSVAVL